MRLNVESYQCILSEKGISDEDVMKSTGLSKKTYRWILKNGFIEFEILERIADAVECRVGDILRKDFEGCSENVIEWIRDTNRATLSLSQRRTISRVKKLAKSHPEKCQIVAENKDGSICAHVPVSWIKINPPRRLTETQLERVSKNILKAPTDVYN